MEHDAQIFGRQLIAAQPQLIAAARWLTRNPEDAHDLVQDTLIRAWRFRERFEPGSNLIAWLRCILRNEHLKTLRHRRVEERYFEATPRNEDVSRPSQEPTIELGEVEYAMKSLARDDVSAILLVGLFGETYDRAAEAMDVNVGTFKSRLNRARRRLRDRLESGAGGRGGGVSVELSQ